MIRLTDLPQWQDLEAHYVPVKDLRIRDQFAAEPDRFSRLSLQLNGILFDLSKNRIVAETQRRLLDPATACDVEGWCERMFAGEAINHSGRRVT